MTSTPRTSAILSRSLLLVLLLIVAALVTWLALAARPALAAGEAATAAARLDPQFAGWALVAAALSTALAALGAGYAVARVGSAAVGAIAEKPELFGRVLVLVGLAEGIAIYGLIVSILILNRIG